MKRKEVARGPLLRLSRYTRRAEHVSIVPNLKQKVVADRAAINCGSFCEQFEFRRLIDHSRWSRQIHSPVTITMTTATTVLSALIVFAIVGCTSYPSGTAITPAHFQFVTVTEPDTHGGGWREVCIKARMSQDIRGTGEVTNFTCNLGVGVPIVLYTGRRISLREAQNHSATTANAAAYATLTRSFGITAGTCKAVRDAMQELIEREISGSRVHECRSVVSGVEIPVVMFP